MSEQLEAALAGYRKSLPAGRIEAMRIDGADYLGIPIHNVDLFTDFGHFNGIGYGADPLVASVSAYGELAEECHRFVAFSKLPVREASYRELIAEVGEHGAIDPLTLVLPAGSHYTPDLSLRWTTVERLDNGAEVYCPVEFVASSNSELGDYGNQLTTAITNGCGAGDTEERALLHALLELLQRDGNADCFRALDRGTVIDPATLDPTLTQLLDDLARRGLKVIPKLARVTCGCASVYAVGDDTSDDRFGLSATACGEAADPDTYRALRKAILECASSHSRKRFNNLPFEELAGAVPAGYFERIRASIDLAEQEPRALRAMVELVRSDKSTVRALLDDSVFLERKRVAAADLPTLQSDAVSDRLQYVLDRLREEGLVPYVLRAASTGGHCSVVKVIVPGIEMEFGSYHRIGARGVERLLEDDPFELLGRSSLPGTAPILLPEATERVLGGPFYLNTARLDRLIDPLYALYREPIAHAAPIAIAEGFETGKTSRP